MNEYKEIRYIIAYKNGCTFCSDLDNVKNIIATQFKGKRPDYWIGHFEPLTEEEVDYIYNKINTGGKQ